MTVFDDHQDQIGAEINERELAMQPAMIERASAALTWAATDLAVAAHVAHDLLERIAGIYDENTDEANDWDSNTIVEQIATLLEEEGYLDSCPDHGVFAATNISCPRHDEDEDDDDE